MRQRHVDLQKVKRWLATDHGERPLGDNPKQPGEPSIFPAAPVLENGRLTGYVYAVLASEKQREILHALNSNLDYRLGLSVFLGTLLISLIVGIITFFLITDSICRIAAVVTSASRRATTLARIGGQLKGNLGVLTSTFNEMADVIVDNFQKLSAADKFRQELIALMSP